MTRAVPEFMVGADVGVLPAELAAPFLRRLSMTRPAPTVEELSPRRLAEEPGMVSSTLRSMLRRRWGQQLWQTGSATDAPLLPERTVIPHLVHGIWLGGPFSERNPLRQNFAAGAHRYRGEVDFVVWTDVPRSVVEEALRTPLSQAGEELATVRSMVEWAQCNGVHLVNLDEVFHAGNPLSLFHPFTAQMARQSPSGYAAASDLLRLDILSLLGGAYVDGDTRFNTYRAGGSSSGQLSAFFGAVASSVHGFTLHVSEPQLDGSRSSSSQHDVIVAPAAHPAMLMWCELVRTSYPPSRFQQYEAPHCTLLTMLGISPNDIRLIPATRYMACDDELVWSRSRPVALIHGGLSV